jgi:hypothetical protein
MGCPWCTPLIKRIPILVYYGVDGCGGEFEKADGCDGKLEKVDGRGGEIRKG